MLGTQNLALFVIAGLLLNMTPGPDSLLIMSRSAAQGWRSGCAAALGVGAGTFVHVFAAAVGLSALLLTSAAAFTAVKLVGAAYLLYIGIQLLRRRGSTVALQETGPVLPHARVFLQGFLTNVLNPKVALFFLAFVPQFIAPDATDKTLAFVVLGCIFNVNGMLWCHFLALSTAFASRRLTFGAAAAAWANRLIGGMFVFLAIKLALARQN
jgi:threonine/homoserine/homoserine lactone efflux protein